MGGWQQNLFRVQRHVVMRGWTWQSVWEVRHQDAMPLQWQWKNAFGQLWEMACRSRNDIMQGCRVWRRCPQGCKTLRSTTSQGLYPSTPQHKRMRYLWCPCLL